MPAVMKTLRFDVADLELGPIGAGRPIAGELIVRYDRTVAVDGKVLPAAPRHYPIPATGLVDVQVLPNDDPAITSGAGFGIVAEVALAGRDRHGTGVRRVALGTKVVPSTLAGPVSWASLPFAASVPASVFVELLAAQEQLRLGLAPFQGHILVDVDAPAGLGPWAVGTDWRGKPLITPAADPGAHLVYVDAPTAGVWLSGTDWRGTQVGAQPTVPQPLDLAAHTASAGVLTVMGADGTVRRLTSDPTRLVAWGDSLTQGHPRPPFAADGSDAWPAVLDAAWSGGTAANMGVAGQTAEQIALRQGALRLTLAAHTIPAGTTSVTVASVETVRSALSNVYTGGTIAGVPVTLEWLGPTSWKITRTTAGDAVAVPAGTPWLPGSDSHADAVTVIFAGRNDALSITADQVDMRAARVVAAVAAMVDRLTPVHPAFLVLGPITATNETTGMPAHTFVTTVNRRLAQLYPANYWDVRAYLRDQAMTDAGLTPTAADNTATAGDTWPPSLAISGDFVHYTPQTAALIAEQVRTILTAKGYLA